MTRNTNRRKNRRGALLIVVLSILILFALIAITFVVVAGNFKRSAQANLQVELTDEQGRALVDQAFYELLRGTTNTASALWYPHDPDGCDSLLEDLYGSDAVVGQLSADGDPTTISGFVAFTATAHATSPTVFKQRDDYYTGRVLTMLDGPAAAISTRITRYLYDESGGTYQFLVEPFERENGAALPVPASGNIFLVNGRPFNGLPGTPGDTAATRDIDESWDAPDVFNPHLAHIPADATNSTQLTASFRDRAMIDSDSSGAPDRLYDPAVDTSVPPLVIDNDRDGIADSVWINMGLPIKSAPDGRRFIPLVSILCLDLDGRANLNAHGSLAHTAVDYTATDTRFWAKFPNPGGQHALNILPRGMGAGPADISLQPLVSAGAYQNILLQRYNTGALDFVPGRTGGDLLNQLHNYNVPNNYSTQATTPGLYANRIDLHGDGMLGVDYGGRPINSFVGSGEMTDSPYETNLVQPDGSDKLYSAADLERLLRYNDIDSKSLPYRLLPLSGEFGKREVRRSVTTHSYSLPVPGRPGHILDQVADLLTAGGVSDDNIDAEIAKMLPLGVRRGGKFDLNRPWGNGTNNGDVGAHLVVDEIADELTAANTTPETTFQGIYGTAPPADYTFGTGQPQQRGRQLYAQHLFCLMMFLMDANYRIPSPVEAITDDAVLKELTIRRVAQWAINVVDFRDPDCIMTPFEYDVNPFNGWHVDGDITTDDNGHADRRVVWGAEYIDLVMTEATALHDRRTRDTDWDNKSDPAGETPDHPTDAQRGTRRIHPTWDPGDPAHENDAGDKDLDQTRIPQGSLLIELYNTRNRYENNPVFPRELYEVDTTAGTAHLDLARKDARTGVYPVWRIAISRPHHDRGDGLEVVPNTSLTYNQISPLLYATTNPDTATFQPEGMSLVTPDHILPIERYVWFTTTAPVAGTHTETAANTFYNQESRPALLPPGEYAVIGPRRQTYIGSKPDSTTNSDPITANADQLIDLNVGGGSTVAYSDLDGNSAYPASPVPAANIKPALTIYAATDSTWNDVFPNGVGLNVSEPLPTDANYYPQPTHDRLGRKDSYGDPTAYATSSAVADLYEDVPFDSQDIGSDSSPANDRPLKKGNIVGSGTWENYRTAFLQRLANPLEPWHAVTNPYVTVDWIPIDLNVFNGEDRIDPDWDDTAHGAFDPDEDNAGTIKFGTRQRIGDKTVTAFDPLSNIYRQKSEVQNHDSGSPVNTADENFQYNLAHTFGYLNRAFFGPTSSGPISNPAGDPPLPFALPTWYDRPYISHYELLLVPHCAPNRFTFEFSSAVAAAPPNKIHDLINNFDIPFRHLLNFYHSSNTGSSGAVKVPHYYRLLEFTAVPSRFTGTRKWYNPTSTPATYQAPFNYLSRFRDPGLVNINTIPGPKVWEGLTQKVFVDTDGGWDEIDTLTTTGRRGTVDSLGRFASPFRTAWIDADQTDVARTLLRPDFRFVGGLFPLIWRYNSVSPPPGFHNHVQRYANFYFQGITRLGNLATTQSNVYAVWITVGYFEVDSTGAIVRELGQDTGEVRRHRGFYIVDRSIPVALQRGVNHNVDRAVLLRRFIE